MLYRTDLSADAGRNDDPLHVRSLTSARVIMEVPATLETGGAADWPLFNPGGRSVQAVVAPGAGSVARSPCHRSGPNTSYLMSWAATPASISELRIACMKGTGPHR